VRAPSLAARPRNCAAERRRASHGSVVNPRDMHTRALPLIPCLLLAAACGDSGNTTMTTVGDDSTTFPQTSSDDDPSNSSDPNPTTDNGTSTSGTTTTGTTGPEPTTDPTTGPDTTTATTGPAPTMCMATGECDGGFCWAFYDPMLMGPGAFECQGVCIDTQGGGNADDAWCIDDAGCCEAGAVCGMDGYCTLPPPETTTDTDTETTDTDTDTTTGDTDTGTSTGTGTDTDTDTDTDTGGLLPLIGVTGLSVFGNCMPAVPPDPVDAKWVVTVDNTTGDAEITAMLTKATLTYEPGMTEFVQGIDVDPTMIGPVPAMMKKMGMMAKTAAQMNLPNDCTRCGKPVKLDLTFDVGGDVVAASAEVMMACAF
jgi:hypothetical protein